MAKDPAFLFYPGDWLGGTLGMSFEEKGAYMELLMMQFTRGHMTEHMIGQTVGQLWVKLQDKFIKDAAGLWYNERLDIEKEKRKNFVNSRNNNIGGQNQYTKDKKTTVNNRGQTNGHMTSHMEDVNKDINDNVFKDIDIRGISLKILTDFKFNEITHQNKLSQISSFIRKLIADNLIDNFVSEYQSYWDYKRKSNSQLQSLETFIADGWQREVWTEKLKTYNNGQQFTREGKQQSIAELREANREFLNNYKS